jgi:hypothetical protein
MASNSNSSDAAKKDKPSTSENKCNNKNFNLQKNQKSSRNQNKGYTNEKTAMDMQNSKSIESSEKNLKHLLGHDNTLALDEGESHEISSKIID